MKHKMTTGFVLAFTIAAAMSVLPGAASLSQTLVSLKPYRIMLLLIVIIIAAIIVIQKLVDPYMEKPDPRKKGEPRGTPAARENPGTKENPNPGVNPSAIEKPDNKKK